MQHNTPPASAAPHSPLLQTAVSPTTAPAVDMLASPLVTGSRGSVVPVSSPTVSKLPGLHYAIAHRCSALQLPTFSVDALSPRPLAATSTTSLSPPPLLHLSPTHCTSPQFVSNVASFYPEASPTDKEIATTQRSKKSTSGTRRGTLDPEAKSVLKAWMFSAEHFAHPYPSEEEKEELATEAGIEVKQLSNWFTNARKRLWQPVLRQSGVEVKNFLSTGRGGPRGKTLDVPVPLQTLPLSPIALDARKCSASESTSASIDALDVVTDRARARKRIKTTTKRHTNRTAVANEASWRVDDEARHSSHAAFQDLEILAATSLIGLHQQPYQPVH